MTPSDTPTTCSTEAPASNPAPFTYQWYLSGTGATWAQSGIILLTAIIAVWTLRSNRSTNGKRATIDVVMTERRDASMQAAKDTLTKLKRENSNIAAYAHQDQADTPEAKAILALLNHYEFVAGGIRDGAFDECTFKRMKHGITIRDWDALCGFVSEVRNSRKHPTLFQDFEWLARRWKKKPLKQDGA